MHRHHSETMTPKCNYRTDTGYECVLDRHAGNKHYLVQTVDIVPRYTRIRPVETAVLFGIVFASAALVVSALAYLMWKGLR